MTDSDEYLAQECTKLTGKIIEHLETLLGEFQQVNFDIITEKPGMDLPMMHKTLAKLEMGLGMNRIVSLILSTLSKEGDTSNVD